MNAEGKVFVITGAGSGIGRALAIGLSKKGAKLVLNGRNVDALEQTSNMLDKKCGAHIVIAGDVTDTSNRNAIAFRAEKELGGIDVLINNAGVSVVGPLSSMSDDDLNKMIKTNLLAPMQMTRDMLGLLKKSSCGRVVNVGSMFGDIAFPLFAGYSATKFGLRGFSDALRRELTPMGIGVTYCAPRATQTGATPAQQHLIEPFAMKIDDASVPAKNIIQAIEADKNTVYPRTGERLFVLLQRLFPSIIDKNLVKQLLASDYTDSVK